MTDEINQDDADSDAIRASIGLPVPERAVPGGGDGEPAAATPDFSQYEALRKAYTGQTDEPSDDLSWLSKAGEDINAAFMRRKPDYTVANEITAGASARRNAPLRQYEQQVALDKAKQNDAMRAETGGFDLDTYGKWLDTKRKAADLGKAGAPNPEDPRIAVERMREAWNAAHPKPPTFPAPPAAPPIPKDLTFEEYQKLTPEQQAIYDRYKGRRPPGEKGAAAGADEWTPGAVDAAVDAYIATGNLPALGMSGNPRAKVFARLAERQAAGEHFDAATAKAGFDSRKQAAAAAEKQAALLEGFTNTADRYGDMLAQMLDSGAVTQSDLPLVNAAKNLWTKYVYSDAPRDQFIANLGALSDEYAKATTGSLGNAALTDAARNAVYARLSAAHSGASIRQIVKQLKAEAAAAVEERRGVAQREITGTAGTSAPTPRHAAPTAAPTPIPGAPIGVPRTPVPVPAAPAGAPRTPAPVPAAPAIPTGTPLQDVAPGDEPQEVTLTWTDRNGVKQSKRYPFSSPRAQYALEHPEAGIDVTR